MLYNDNEPWKKLKETIGSCFNVTISSFDVTEICELIGIHILYLPPKKLDKYSAGLYSDNDIVFKTENRWNRKDIIQTFKNAGLKIEIKTNLHIVERWNI